MTSVGGYQLETQIGAGASGTVWRAHRQGPVLQVVALKRLRGAASTPTDLARLRREATVLTELDHPHIVRVLEVLDDDEGLALAMQYAPGGSLEVLLASRGRLAPGEVVAVAAPIADALASAHRRGVVHGDVKPANILFTSDGEPLLGDFGVARTLGHLTSDMITGTAHYLAPEVLDGAVPDPRTDIYALAVVCYEALAGRPPYAGAVPLAVVRAADAGIHDPLSGQPGVPPTLAQVVEQGMAREPGQRFPSADLFAQALRGAVPHRSLVLPGPAAGAGAGPVGLGPVGPAGPAGPAGVVAGPGGVGGPAAVAGVGSEDDATRGTRTFGPRPPRRDPEAPVRRFRLPGAFFVLLIVAGALYLIRGPLRPNDECPQVEPPVAEPGAQIVSGDPEGDGCQTYGVYQEQALADGRQLMLLTIRVDGEELRIELGEPGDQVFIGDWDCSGDDTPGVYRRTAGEVQYYDIWPEVAAELHQPDDAMPATPGATASLVAGSGSGSESGSGDDGSGDGRSGGEPCDRIAVA